MSASATREPLLARACARKKAQTRHKIQAHALRLFLAKGYEATTVEEIAAAAGVSHMTFFRHYPTKESVVDTDDYDPMIARLITSRPSTEDPLTAIHQALRQGFAAVLPEGRDMLLTRTRLVLTTPALRAWLWENQHATARLFTDALTARHHATTLPGTGRAGAGCSGPGHPRYRPGHVGRRRPSRGSARACRPRLRRPAPALSQS